MRIHNLYEDANGESHFRDIEVDWIEETRTGKLSKRLPATGIMFRETTTDYENSWHRAPRRQYVISLAGGMSITASDGETRHIGVGEIVLVEDTTGKATSPNHRARNRATRSSCQSIDGWRALRPAASWEFKLMGAAACGAASPARLASTPDHHTVGCVDGSLLAITSSTRLPAHDNNPLQASSAENPLHSAPVAVSEYAIALPTLDGDPACALGSISSFGSKALWFEITDGLRQYRPMPSFFPPERSGDMRA